VPTEPHQYLTVASQTLGGDQLSAKLAEYMGAGPCRSYLVAPVTQNGQPAPSRITRTGPVPAAFAVDLFEPRAVYASSSEHMTIRRPCEPSRQDPDPVTVQWWQTWHPRVGNRSVPLR
jgi:hypothetical protein